MQLPESFTKIPCSGKIPSVNWKDYIERKPTLEEKNSWNVLYPDSGVGIVTGKLSGVLVLDDDGGLSDTDKVNLPQTWTVKTPRGGTHYYFRWDERLDNKVTTKRELYEKVDIRGEGGFIAFYGFEKSLYTFPMALAPQWLVDLLPNRIVTETTKPIENEESLMLKSLEEIIPKDSSKGRNPTFLRAIGTLKKKGLLLSEVKAFLAPWGEKYDYTIKLNKLIEDQFKRYPQPIQIDGSSANIESFLQNEQKVSWIIPGLVAQGTIGFVCGLPESGKTWLLMDLAIEIARGGLWIGKFQTKQGKVLLIDQERFKGETQRRLRSLLTAKQLSSKSLKDFLSVKCGTTTRIDLEHSFQAFKKELNETKPDVIIIDSFVSFHSKEENNRREIQEVLERIKALRIEFGCTFIFIDHNGKSAYHEQQEGKEVSYITQAGSIAKPAAAEFEFSVVKTGEDIMCYNTKNNLATTVEPFMFRIENLMTDGSSIQVKGY